MTERDIASSQLLTLRGVDHTARPTWKLRETIEFYRDKLGLPLVHTISARGWGPATHPDFLHFFFDSGNGSTIAFFYYLGSDMPDAMQGREYAAPVPEDHITDATHTAWLVDSASELQAWKTKLEASGLKVSVETRHEVIESIYVRDPNGYFIEFTRKLRPLGLVDSQDAELTLKAALAAEDAAAIAGKRLSCIDDVWAAKANMLDKKAPSPKNFGASGKTLGIYVPRVEEFSSLLQNAALRDDCRFSVVGNYDLIEAEVTLQFDRRALGLKPAVWYGLFTGGVRGRIEKFDRDSVVISPAAKSSI